MQISPICCRFNTFRATQMSLLLSVGPHVFLGQKSYLRVAGEVEAGRPAARPPPTHAIAPSSRQPQPAVRGLAKGDRSTRWRARWLALNPARGHELGTRWVGKKSPRCTHEALPPQPLTPGAGDCISPRAQAIHRWLARAVAAPSPSPSTPAPLGPTRPATAAASRKGEPGAPRGRGFMSFAARSSMDL